MPEPVDSNRSSGHCTTNHNESGRSAPAEALTLTKVEIGRMVCPLLARQAMLVAWHDGCDWFCG
jgi:hypothetical protein